MGGEEGVSAPSRTMAALIEERAAYSRGGRASTRAPFPET